MLNTKKTTEYNSITEIKKEHGHRPFIGHGFTYDTVREVDYLGGKYAIPVFYVNRKDELVLLGAVIQKMNKYMEDMESGTWHPARYYFGGIMSPWRYRRLLKENDPKGYTYLEGKKAVYKQVSQKEKDKERQKLVGMLNDLDKKMNPTQARQNAKRQMVAEYHEKKDRKSLISLLKNMSNAPATNERKVAKKAAVKAFREKHPKSNNGR